MYFGYTIPELATFSVAAVIIIWSFWKILTKSRHSSTFFFWFLIGATVFCLWAWRSGNALYLYQKIKTDISTPQVEP